MQTGHLAGALTLTVCTVAGSTSLGQTLRAAMACGERDAMVHRLEETFGEVQKGAGLVSGAQLLEVWGSDETGTWTILMTGADGRSCVIAAGEAWRDVETDLAAKGDPA